MEIYKILERPFLSSHFVIPDIPDTMKMENGQYSKWSHARPSHDIQDFIFKNFKRINESLNIWLKVNLL